MAEEKKDEVKAAAAPAAAEAAPATAEAPAAEGEGKAVRRRAFGNCVLGHDAETVLRQKLQTNRMTISVR